MDLQATSPIPTDEEASTLMDGVQSGGLSEDQQRHAADVLSVYKQAKEAKGLRMFQPDPDDRVHQIRDAEANYGESGPAGIDQFVPEGQRAQFAADANNTPDPLETRAAVANQQFIAAAHPELKDQVDTNWETVRQQAAAAYGVDKENPSDLELYAAIGKHVATQRDERSLIETGLRKSQLQQLDGSADTWMKAYNYWRNGAEGKPGFDPAKADSYRQMFEASWHETESTASAVAPVVNAIADEFERAKADPGKAAGEYSVGSALHDKPLLELLQNLPPGVSPEDVIAMATHKAFSQTGGESDKGVMESVIRGGRTLARGAADFVGTSLLQTFDALARNAGPMSPEDEAALKEGEQKFIQTQKLKNLLNDAFAGEVAQVGGPVSHYFYKTAEMIPAMGLAAAPSVGVPLLVSSFTGEAKQRLLERGASFQQANIVGSVEGLAQAATFYLTSNMVVGNAPFRLAEGAAAESLGGVLSRAVKISAGEAGGVSAITAIQQLTPPLIESLAHSLSSSFPEVKWKEQFSSMAKALPETLITLAPLVLLGSGVAGFKEAGKWREFTADTTALTARGFSPEFAQKLARMPFEDRLAEIQRVNEKLNKELADRPNQRVQESARILAAADIKAENVRQSAQGGELLRQQYAATEAQQEAAIAEINARAQMDTEGPAMEKGASATAERGADGQWEVRDPAGQVVDYAPTPEEAQKLVNEVNRSDPRAQSGDPLPPAVDEHSTPGAQSMGIVGSADAVAAVTRAWESISKTRRAFLVHVNRGQAKKEVAREFQAQDNKATIFGRVNAEEIENALARAMGRTKKNGNLGPAARIDRQALTFLRESQDSKATLQQWRDALDAAIDPKNPQAVGEAKRAIDHALANYDRLVPVSQRFNDILNDHLAQQRAMGISVGERAGYVPHWQDIDSGILNIFEGSSGGSGSSGAYKHARSFDTYFDSIMGGIRPKTLDAVTLLERRLSTGQKSINRQLWATAARNVIDPSSLLPVVADMEVGTKEVDGKSVPDVKPPLGYEPMQVGGRQVAVQEGYTGLFRALQDPGFVQNSAGGQALMKGVQTAKSVALFFDTFHLGRIAMHQMVLRGKPTYGKGLLYLDHSVAELTRQIDSGELGAIPPALKAQMLESKRRLDLLVNRGLNVAAAFENQNVDWVHNLPGIGAYNHWLFEKFQRGGMVLTGLVEFERMRKQLPNATDEQVASRVADDINTRFGNLGAQSWIKSRALRDLSRILFLAPGWNEGLLRSELGAVLQLAETAKMATVGGEETVNGVTEYKRRFVAGTLLRNVGGLVVGQFLANQVINYITRGTPTWENPEEGFSAKLSAFIPDAAGGPGFFLNPFSLPAEITHTLMKKVESGDSFAAAGRGLIENKLSAIGRAGQIFVTGRNNYPDGGAAQILKALGHDLHLPHQIQTTPDMIKSIGNALFPVPIPTTPVMKAAQTIRTGEVTQSRPGEIQSQIMQSVGVKTEGAPGPTQRIQHLAREFKQEHGIKLPPDVGDSDYSAIRAALKSANKGDIEEAMTELLTHRKPFEVANYFSRYAGLTFTGSRLHEKQFKAGLSTEQKKVYAQAQEERKATAKAGIAALKASISTKKP